MKDKGVFSKVKYILDYCGLSFEMIIVALTFEIRLALEYDLIGDEGFHVEFEAFTIKRNANVVEPYSTLKELLKIFNSH